MNDAVMEDAITALARACSGRREVGMLTREDGTVLLVYPLEPGAIVGIGTRPGFERKIRSVLRKRSDALPRFGNWRPALFNDGSCFVLTRIGEIPEHCAVLEADILAAAVELIS